MEQNKHPFPWLALIGQPAFCVKDGIVVDTNKAAWFRSVCTGDSVREMIGEHWDTYNSFQEGTMYFPATVEDEPYDITVIRTPEYDIFTMQRDEDSDHLKALALAAQQLRIPLSNVMTVTDRLLASLDEENLQARQQAGQINHSLFQLLRIVSNMSDAGNYRKTPFIGMQTANITGVFRETMEKITATAANANICYTGPDRPILGLADTEKLERAIYNLMSNAIKFAVPGSAIDAKLAKKGDQLAFTVCNTQEANPEQRRFWDRYSREPAIEDVRYGLGLGMALISRTAACHGGTVLIDHPKDGMTRVIMTIAIAKDSSATVRTPIMRIGDYAGGRDKVLLEFADILPNTAYEDVN